MMEQQICRIKSENDLRYLNANSANISKDAAKAAQDNLLLELGEKFQVERPTMVKPQKNARQRFEAISRG